MKKIAFLLLVWCTASSFTLHLMGDSTMADKDLSNGNPERGWGMLFRNFVDGDVQVINYAKKRLEHAQLHRQGHLGQGLCRRAAG